MRQKRTLETKTGETKTNLLLCGLPFVCISKLESVSNHLAHSVQ